ncbi:hypothetical protein E3Q24_03609 [Wallemia mellicola]|uniref:BZIP domain-containing protein n=1 Tax=Wallemia mellicola TaxID=1708541 RepID=A0AB38MYJ9_9BASI|nr:hypothetical protein E3Q24_03609 [Wallemia mellicola]TIC51852.1 hypothetical protein E3Q04_03697 [Wallemia mellicola]TIC66231.1 hypothetical protein E3Q02_01890 [Wallemia mellicola]TIC67563.1 hypothetical protein E3Q03_01860 [Wallemia mellicola]
MSAEDSKMKLEEMAKARTNGAEVNPFEKSFIQYNTPASATAATATTNGGPLFTPGLNSFLESFGSDNSSFNPYVPQQQPQRSIHSGIEREVDRNDHNYVSPSKRKSNKKPWREVDLDDTPELMKPVGRAGNPSLHVSQDGRELSTEERKKLMLDRNREAASRCRQRKKNWINQVQDQADLLQKENAQLRDEILKYRHLVLELREQCTELKASLANKEYKNGSIVI